MVTLGGCVDRPRITHRVARGPGCPRGGTPGFPGKPPPPKRGNGIGIRWKAQRLRVPTPMTHDFGPSRPPDAARSRDTSGKLLAGFRGPGYPLWENFLPV